jgi:solute carrier family 25 thiamine pyrophosphate transporter 19
MGIAFDGFHMPWGSGHAKAGVIASVMSKTAIFPLDLVRKRIQLQGPTSGRYIYGDRTEYKSALGALRTIVRAEGFRGLFKGLPISLIKAAPASAVTVWTYERTLNFLMSMDKDKEDAIS